MNKMKFCLLALLVAVLVGCQDDDSFTTSPQNLLSCSTDTVRFDTVFSAVPTTTKTFWIFNDSGDGIRCTSVRQEKATKSGFRVNVDGVYLGPETNYQTSNVEIRKGDSIRVFVELTSKMVNADEPQLVEDNLIFHLESGVEQAINLNAYSWDAVKVTDLHIGNDTTIASTKPIIVYGGITVEEGKTLTIAGGTTLYFHDNAGIDVFGRLVADGSADNEVTLRGDRIDRMFDYLPYDLTPGRWEGVKFHTSSYDNELKFTDLHSPFNAIICDSADVTKTKLTLKNSTVHNCQGYGVMASNCKIVMENCQLTNALEGSVVLYGGDVTMNHCTLAQFYPFDANRKAALRYQSTEKMPLKKMDFINGIVTGYGEDQVAGSRENETVDFNYRFISSILRTEAVEDAERIIDVAFEDVKDTASIQGQKHFRLVNINTQHYDFHLSKVSTAVGKGNKEWPVSDDRDGTVRDENPDLGCYEYKENEGD